ncbi:hypothetical protein [Teichococcus wenyumeiae]|nr:hypothetical protein [Pseudoroseomonas wenyumeiae]
MPQTAQSLLMALRGTATQDAPAAPVERSASLLEELRASSAASPAPREGLLGLLAQPAVWDLPLAAPQPHGFAPLAGRPIQAPTPDQALLNLPPGGFGGPPATAPAQPLWSQQPAAPPPAAAMAPEPPAVAARTRHAPAPATGSLAEMFRMVSAVPPPPAEPPKPTDSLKDILRGLRPDRRA